MIVVEEDCKYLCATRIPFDRQDGSCVKAIISKESSKNKASRSDEQSMLTT